MNRQERQIELQVTDLHVREAEDRQTRSRTIEGYAVVFGVRSVNLTPWSERREVYEIMEPGSITQELLNRSDVVLTAFHDNTAILGRWRMGKGTLSLSLDTRGMKIGCTLAKTARADELLSAIERGDISGMSFAFTADEEDSENGVSYERIATKNGKEVFIRHVKRVTGLYDVTIAGHPAYEQTTVAQREIDEFFDKHCPHIETDEERQKREAEEAAKKAEEEAQRKAEEEAKAKAEAETKAKAEEQRQQTIRKEQRRAMRRHMAERDINNIY